MEYAYNAASELTTVTHKQGTTTLATLTYTYDGAGNRLQTGGTFARTNVPPALTSATYNANNQQTAFGTTTETYDLNGNLATSTETGVTTTYTWNARNQLTGISRTGLTTSFTYDSFGRRTGKTINGTTTNFLYDGLNPVQEKNGATVTANLLIGLSIDEFFTRTDSVGVRALLPDALGSTVALGDSAGALQTQYTYEPFGITTQTGAASTSSYKFTGREDDGTELYHYRARYYQPRLQRFISEDPVGLKAGPNLYLYVWDNPFRFNDPIGLCACPGGVWDQEFGDSQVTIAFGGYFSIGKVNYTCRSNPSLKCSGRQICFGGGPIVGAGISWNLTGAARGADDSSTLGGWSGLSLAVASGPIGVQAPLPSGAGGNVSGGAAVGGGGALTRCYTDYLKCTCPCNN